MPREAPSEQPHHNPGRDPAIEAFCRQHPDWEVWRAISTIYHARLHDRPDIHVRGEDLADLSDEIRRAEARLEGLVPQAPPDLRHSRYMEAAAVEDRDLAARLANIRRRLDSREYTPLEGAREQIRVLTEHLSKLRRLRAKHLGTARDADARNATVSEIQELLRPTGWNDRD